MPTYEELREIFPRIGYSPLERNLYFPECDLNEAAAAADATR